MPACFCLRICLSLAVCLSVCLSVCLCLCLCLCLRLSVRPFVLLPVRSPSVHEHANPGVIVFSTRLSFCHPWLCRSRAGIAGWLPREFVTRFLPESEVESSLISYVAASKRLEKENADFAKMPDQGFAGLQRAVQAAERLEPQLALPAGRWEKALLEAYDEQLKEAKELGSLVQQPGCHQVGRTCFEILCWWWFAILQE